MEDQEPTFAAPEPVPEMGWKWMALMEGQPSPFDRAWRAWLGEAQRAEQEANLRYWSRRSSQDHLAAA